MTKKSRVNDLDALPTGFKWVYPTKGKPIHGYRGRFAWNGEVGLSYRQVRAVAGGEKSYEEALAVSLGGRKNKTENKIIGGINRNYARYEFTSESESSLFLSNLPKRKDRSGFLQGYGPVQDNYEEDDTGNRWLRLSQARPLANWNTENFRRSKEYNTYKLNFIGDPTIYEVVLYDN